MLRSRLIYLGLLIGAFIFSQALFDSISLFTLALVLVIPFFSLLCLLISMLLIRIEAELPPERVERLADFSIKMKIISRTPIMLPMIKIKHFTNAPEGDRAVSGVSVVQYAAVGTTTLEIPLKFQVRGLYKVGVESVVFYDFLRLFSIRRKVGKEGAVVVGPRNLALNFAVEPARQEQENTATAGGQETRNSGDISGIREFNEYDTLRQVHWKLSARLSKMIVKTYWENSCDNIMVLADLFPHEEDQRQNRHLTDCVVEIARQVTSALAEQGARSTLAYAGPGGALQTHSIGNPAEQMLADEQFAMSPMPAGGRIYETLREMDVGALQGGALYVVSSMDSKTLWETVSEELEGINCKVQYLVVRPQIQQEYGSDMKVITLSELER